MCCCQADAVQTYTLCFNHNWQAGPSRYAQADRGANLVHLSRVGGHSAVLDARDGREGGLQGGVERVAVVPRLLAVQLLEQAQREHMQDVAGRHEEDASERGQVRVQPEAAAQMRDEREIQPLHPRLDPLHEPALDQQTERHRLQPHRYLHPASAHLLPAPFLLLSTPIWSSPAAISIRRLFTAFRGRGVRTCSARRPGKQGPQGRSGQASCVARAEDPRDVVPPSPVPRAFPHFKHLPEQPGLQPAAKQFQVPELAVAQGQNQRAARCACCALCASVSELTACVASASSGP
eukprot:2377525-Rhodomonas_salina.1